MTTVAMMRTIKTFFAGRERFMKVVIVLLLAAIFLPGCQTTGSYEEPPLPTDVKIEQPDNHVPPEQAAYSGIWYGTFGRELYVKVVVERVYPPFAYMIYSWGTGIHQKHAGWTRVTGAFDGEELNASVGRGVELNMRMQENGTMYATYIHRDWGFTSATALRRVE